MADIATAIKGSADAGVAHRDITPNNFGHILGRGILYDFSAGKVSAEVTVPCGLVSSSGPSPVVIGTGDTKPQWPGDCFFWTWPLPQLACMA